MNTEDESLRGQEAKKLLDNPLYIEAIAAIRDGIVSKWRSAPIRDKEGMHELKLMDKVLSDIDGYIHQVADTGKMADIQLERERKLEIVRKAGIR